MAAVGIIATQSANADGQTCILGMLAKFDGFSSDSGGEILGWAFQKLGKRRTFGIFCGFDGYTGVIGDPEAFAYGRACREAVFGS